jgi:hypothetical protein
MGGWILVQPPRGEPAAQRSLSSPEPDFWAFPPPDREPEELSPDDFPPLELFAPPSEERDDPEPVLFEPSDRPEPPERTDDADDGEAEPP